MQFGRPIVKASAQPLNPLSPNMYRNSGSAPQPTQQNASVSGSHIPAHNPLVSVANLMSAAASANQRPIVGNSSAMTSQLSPEALRMAQLHAQLQAANTMRE